MPSHHTAPGMEFLLSTVNGQRGHTCKVIHMETDRSLVPKSVSDTGYQVPGLAFEADL